MVMLDVESVFYRQILTPECVIESDEKTKDKENPENVLDKQLRSYISGELKRKQDHDDARIDKTTDKKQPEQKQKIRDPKKPLCSAFRKLVDHLKGFREDRKHEIVKVENNIIGTSLVDSGEADTIYYLHLDTNEISTQLPIESETGKTCGNQSPKLRDPKLIDERPNRFPDKSDVLRSRDATKYTFGASIMSPGISYLLQRQSKQFDLESKTAKIENVNKPKQTDFDKKPNQNQATEIDLPKEQQLELRVTNAPISTEITVHDDTEHSSIVVPSGDEDDSVLNDYHHEGPFDVARKLHFDHSDELSVFQPPESTSTPQQTPTLSPKTSQLPQLTSTEIPALSSQAPIDLQSKTVLTDIQSSEAPPTQVLAVSENIRLSSPSTKESVLPPPSPTLLKLSQTLDASMETAGPLDGQTEVDSTDELDKSINLKQIDSEDTINSQNGYEASVESVSNESTADTLLPPKRTHSLKSSDERSHNRSNIESVSSDHQHPLLVDSSDEELEVFDELFVTDVQKKTFQEPTASETIEDNLSLSYDEYKTRRSSSPFISIDITNSFREEDEPADRKSSNMQSTAGGSEAKEPLPNLAISTITSPFEAIAVEETESKQHGTRREKKRSAGSSGSSSPFEMLFV